jgi:S-adenosylmethionine synthetase
LPYRYIAKNIVAAGCTEEWVQISYAIGVADPISVFINTMAQERFLMKKYWNSKNFDMRPKAIIEHLRL